MGDETVVVPRARKHRLNARLPSFLGLVAVLLLLQQFIGLDWELAGTIAGFYALAAIGLEVLWGLAGQISLGQGAFMALGAYSSALLTTKGGLPAFVAAVLGLLICAGVAVILGKLVLGLKPIYLAIATMGFALVVPALIAAFPEVTEGAAGVFGIPPIEAFGTNLSDSEVMYPLIWGLVLLSAYGVLRIASSRTGLAWKLVGEHQEVAEAVGVNVEQRKMQALLVSAMFGSVGGSLYAHYTQVVSPVSFGFNLLLVLVITVIVGGLGTGYGPVIGAIVVGLITMQSGSAGEYTSVVFGAIFLIVLYVAPAGLVGVIRSITQRMRRRTQSGGPSPVVRQLEDISSLLERIRQTLQITDTATGSAVVLEGISKSFGGVAANTDVSIDIRAGEVLGLIGPNGAGKSTIVNVATGVYTADSGRIIWDGQDITAWTAHSRAKAGMARTFQRPSVILGLSVLDNVAIGAYRFGHVGLYSSVFGPAGRKELARLHSAALSALEIVGLAEFARQDAGTLSFGQRRLAELARAIVSLPRVIFLDEPLSGLDAAEKEQIIALLDGLRRAGVAVCIIEHDTQAITTISDRICVLDFGRVLCVGSPDDVFNDPRVRASYMGETIEL